MGEGSIALGEEFEYQRERENGASDEQIVVYLSLSGSILTTATDNTGDGLVQVGMSS